MRIARLPIGRRVRMRRQERDLTQAALAELVGISTSYLNLIEHDKRPIAGALLNRIAAALGVEPAWLNGLDNARLAQDLLELARGQPTGPADEPRTLDFVVGFPDWAEAFLQLHRRYRDATETALALSDRLSQDPALMELSHAVLTRVTSIRSFAEILEQFADLNTVERARFSAIIASEADQLGSSARAMIQLLGVIPGNQAPASPIEEVDDFIVHHRSYFSALEDAAAEILRRLSSHGEAVAAAIADRLGAVHGVRIETFDGEAGSAPAPGSNVEWLDERLPETTCRFHLARALIVREIPDLLTSLAEDPLLSSAEARARGRRALAGYAAGALLFPYDSFLAAAESSRYDIERMAHRFGGSFEQCAHRLVTLRRPGAEGIPFAFLRSDPAGNLSKRFSIPGLRMPRFGGACPLWPIYGAFRSPERIVTQVASMPEGERYLFIARCVSKQRAGFGQAETLFSVMLGCDAAFADRIVYAKGTGSAAAVGFSCRSCNREDCAQRAQPAILARGK